MPDNSARHLEIPEGILLDETVGVLGTRALVDYHRDMLALADLAISLSGCGSAAFEPDSCPTWPTAGPAVAEEMEAGAMPPDRFPAFWEWMGRLDKLRDQLSDC